VLKNELKNMSNKTCFGLHIRAKPQAGICLQKSHFPTKPLQPSLTVGVFEFAGAGRF